VEKSMNLIERIFQRKRLRYLEDQIRQLQEEKERLATGDSVQLTLSERQMIWEAINLPQVKALISEPITKKAIRIVYKNLKEKIRASLKEK